MHAGAKELWMKIGDHSDSRTPKRKKNTRFSNPGEIFAHQKFLYKKKFGHLCKSWWHVHSNLVLQEQFSHMMYTHRWRNMLNSGEKSKNC